MSDDDDDLALLSKSFLPVAKSEKVALKKLVDKNEVAQALLDQQLRQLQTELDRKQQLDAQAAEHASRAAARAQAAAEESQALERRLESRATSALAMLSSGLCERRQARVAFRVQSSVASSSDAAAESTTAPTNRVRCAKRSAQGYEGGEYEAEAIVDFRLQKRRREYLVKWVGYPDEDSTWEPESNLTECPNLLATYQQSHQQSSVNPLPVYPADPDSNFPFLWLLTSDLRQSAETSAILVEFLATTAREYGEVYAALPAQHAHLLFVLACNHCGDELNANRAFEILLAHWLNRADHEVRFAVGGGLSLSSMFAVLPNCNAGANRWHPAINAFADCLAALGLESPLIQLLRDTRASNHIDGSEGALSETLVMLSDADSDVVVTKRVSSFPLSSLSRTLWLLGISILIRGDSWPVSSRLAVLRLTYALFLDPIVTDSSVASAASALLDALLRSLCRDANETFAKRIVRISDSARIKSLAAEFEREAFQPLCEAILLHTSADIGSLLRVAAWWPSPLLGPANQNADGAFAHRSLQWLAAVALRLCFVSDAPDSTQLACRALFERGSPSLQLCLAFLVDASEDYQPTDACGRCSLSFPCSPQRISQLIKTFQLLLIVAGDGRSEPAETGRLLKLTKAVYAQTNKLDPLCSPLCDTLMRALNTLRAMVPTQFQSGDE